MSVFLLVVGILLFIGLVVVHEFGHFLAARRNGVEVEEFGIGFPPRAWGRKTKKGFLFSLNWLPIGGFVKLKGENDANDEKGSFGAASFGTKAKIMLAGVGMNLLAAFVIFMALAWVGMPQLIPNQYAVKSDTKVAQRQVYVYYVEPGSPAAKAGLQPRDHLDAIGPVGHEQAITSAEALPAMTKKYAGQHVAITYSRSGQAHTVQTTLRTSQQAKGAAYLGMEPTEFILTRATWSAPIQSAGLIWQFTDATFRGLGTAISAVFHGNGSQAGKQLTGPIGIVVIMHDGSLMGYQFMLLIIGLVSLSLAIMNILPIPALDGGRFYMIVLSRIFGKRLSRQAEERIVGASFVFLLLLVVLITIVDVKRFF